MTGGYRAVSGLAVRHPYFASGWPSGLQLQADDATAALMARFGLLLRGDARRYVLMASERGLDGLWSVRAEWPEGGLTFAARSTDPLWAYYTDVRAMASAGPFRLTLALAPRDCASLSDWLAAAPLDNTVLVPVRWTFWKYLLVGDWGQALSVVDAAGAVAFGAPEPETLPDGTLVTVVRSTMPLALQERPGHRFQLRRGLGSDTRVLMARLPQASPAALRREVVDGALCDVSEVFVNR